MHARQQALDYGPADHFRALHGGHAFPVAVATEAQRGRFKSHVYAHDDAGAVVVNLAPDDDHATFLSQAGFASPGGRHSIDQVRAVASLWADLDAYQVPELRGLDADALLDRALALFPWLPLPSLLVDSGRGAYFIWLLDEPLPASRLHEWQRAMYLLVSELEPLGADKGARDAARFLRVSGSFHLLAGERVQARRIGDAVSFDAMYQAIDENASAARLSRCRAVPDLRTVHDADNAPATGKAPRKGLRPWQLAHDRMHDYATLVRLRGGKLTDRRHRMLYAYAQSVAWFVGDAQRLREEVDAFAAAHFADSARYRAKRVASVIDRFIDDGHGRLFHLRRVENAGRYRFTNDYLIALLGITPAEQRELRTIIGSAEKRRRLIEKRRAAGMATRDAYVAPAAERRAQACRMRSEGVSVAEIAKRLGVSRVTVYRYLDGSAM